MIESRSQRSSYMDLVILCCSKSTNYPFLFFFFKSEVLLLKMKTNTMFIDDLGVLSSNLKLHSAYFELHLAPFAVLEVHLPQTAIKLHSAYFKPHLAPSVAVSEVHLPQTVIKLHSAYFKHTWLHQFAVLEVPLPHTATFWQSPLPHIHKISVSHTKLKQLKSMSAQQNSCQVCFKYEMHCSHFMTVALIISSYISM